jgi:UPF0716 family protein affecting phage T7 exclusion
LRSPWIALAAGGLSLVLVLVVVFAGGLGILATLLLVAIAAVAGVFAYKAI